MKKIIVAIMSIFLLAGVLLAEDIENADDEAKYYDNAKVIRIKNVEGEGFVQRSYEEGYEEATRNLPIFEKDTVGTGAGRLGIYLGRLNYLRLDSDTQIEMLGIPQLRKTDLIARMEKGSIYLDIENLDNEKSIEIQTPDCGIFILDKGIYRINVDKGSLTEVYVMEGTAEVAGRENSRNVRENQKIVMAQGEIEERPYYFYASEKDDFDRWNDLQNREQGYARFGTSRYLQSGYEDYEYEMSRAGRWSYMSDFNSYVWTPYYSNTSWMPYGNGRWVWNPHYGYVWTSYDNCGWFTHHYGRWHWSYSGGWYWIPGYHWSPAWVSWFWDNDYYGWCPLSWWNRPVIVINNRWDHNYNYRHGMPHRSRSTIIIRKNELAAPNMQHVALNRSNLGLSGEKVIAYRGAAPGEHMAATKVTVLNAKGKSMIFKQNSIVSGEKYKISNSESTRSNSGTGNSTVYKYNNSGETGSKYSPRIYRPENKNKDNFSGSKSVPANSYRSKKNEKGAETETGRYSGSKNSGEASAKNKTGSTNSGNSGDKSQSKTSTRNDSASSSKTSSSDGSSSRAAKKKKDEAAYQALMQSENSAGYKSHAAEFAGNQSKYSAASNNTRDYSYGSYKSKTNGEPGSTGAYSPVSKNRFSGSRETASANSGLPHGSYSSHNAFTSRGEAVKGRASYQSFSTSSARNDSYNGNSSNRNYSSTFAGNERRINNSATHATVSAPSRSANRSTAIASHSSSNATATAKKKN